MAHPESFTVVSYQADGMLENMQPLSISELNAEHISFFQAKFNQYLTGDLELPYEDKLPGEIEHIEFRIGSDLNGAYVLYYFHDEVIFASLLLSGTDQTAETELMQVFKFLLLDNEDMDNPTEEEIEAILSSDEFDFLVAEERPVAYQIDLAARTDERQPTEHVREMDRHLAAAFFQLDERSMPN